MDGYQIVSEAIVDSSEYAPLRKARVTKPHIYMFHGTPLNLYPTIKKEGLRISKMGKYVKDIFLISKDVIFLTSVLSYAEEYSKSKMPIFQRSKSIIALCKVETKSLERLFSDKTMFMKFDEYIYKKDIPVRDIVWSTDNNFQTIIDKVEYLR